MVQITIHVRPKNGYTYPGKLNTITVDTSTRVEQVVTDLKLDVKRGIALYSHAGRREIALNSSLASNNVQHGDIVETCACPTISAALSMVLQDLNILQTKYPHATDRTQSAVQSIMGGIIIDPWHIEKWDNESINSRIICMALMKKVLQKQERFANVPVPHCTTLEQLYTFVQTLPVFSETPRQGTMTPNQPPTTTRRGRYNAMAHLFKPSTNRDGKPSTVWQLLHHKLQQLQQLSQQQVTNGTSSTSARNHDPIERFL
jgi:hypothetical protein